MIQHISTCLILLGMSISLPAQTIKTGVLVVGNTPGSISASIQSARSGAKTILLTQTPSISTELLADDLLFLEKIQNHYTFKDNKKSTLIDSILPKNMSLEQSSKLIKSITDTVKNLTVTLNNGIDKIEKDGKGWEIKLKGGQKIKADVLVDATQNLTISSMLKIDPTKTIISLSTTDSPFGNKLYRSTVAIGYLEHTNSERSVFTIPLGSLLPAGVENFILVPKNVGAVKPNMSTGQAAGSIAAFCSFFKTTTKNINVRVVQGELLAFDARLIPFTDIKLNDPNAMAFQRMGVSGLLKARIVKEGNLNAIRFDTTGTVSAEELRLPMKEFYSRSQIWFADNKKEILAIEDAISLFMFTASRGEELKREIENGWKESFKFSSNFDIKRAITRKELVVLADRYLQPFNVRIDLAGNLLR